MVNHLYNNKYQIIHFPVYGIEFWFKSNSSFYVNEILSDFKHFGSKSEKTRYPDFSIVIHFFKNSDYFPLNPKIKERLNREPFIGSNNLKFRILNYENKWLIIESGPAETIYLLSLNFRTGHIFTAEEDPEIYHAISELIMNFLSMYFLNRNIFCVHAAALSKEKKGFLFPGRSGSGKTTISISLIKANYKFLSDDYPLIRNYDSKFEMLAFPQRLKIRNDTLKQHSELIAYTKKKKIETERPFIDISEVFSGCLTKRTEVVFLIFPKLISSLKTNYRKISKNEALKKLLPCMFDPFSNFETSIALRKLMFEFAYNLVNKTMCFELLLGKNTSELENVLESLRGA